MLKKITSTVLAAAILTASVAMATACTEKNSKNPSSSDNTNNNIYADNLPSDLNFADRPEEERTVTIAFVEGGSGYFTERSLWADEDSSDKVDIAVYKRNQTIEARLGITIDPYMASTDWHNLRNDISASLAAQDPEYDVIAAYQYFDIALASDGYLININNLGNELWNAPYIDLSREYWSTDYINALSYKNAVYWLTGDLALRYLGGMYCTFVNGDIYDRYLQTTYGDIYQLAKEGKWTLDMLAEMAALCYEDMNGNDQVDEEDQLGFILEVGQDPIEGMAFGSNVQFSSRNADGSISITLNNENTVNFSNKMYEIINSGYFYAPGNSDSANQMNLFASGNVAFTVNKIYQAEVYLNEMENYYILPTPKLNSTQENYVTGIHDGCTIFGITYCSDAVPAAAALLEAMAAESYRTVTPEYFDTALKYRYTRDPNAAEMIDLIRSCVNTDFAAAWSQDLNGIVHFFRTGISKNIASTLKRNQTVWNVYLEKLTEKLEEYSVDVT